jgi:hypothetical protein
LKPVERRKIEPTAGLNAGLKTQGRLDPVGGTELKERIVTLLRTKIKFRYILLAVTVLFMMGPGLICVKYFTISTKKLPERNPTSYIFHINSEEMQQRLWKTYCYYCGGTSSLGCPNQEGLTMNSPTKLVMSPSYWQKSETYFWMGSPLDYTADYLVEITPRSISLTEVTIKTSNSYLRIGPAFTTHGGNLNRPVAPTTVEEYRFLLTLGCALGESGMPPLQLPR